MTRKWQQLSYPVMWSDTGRTHNVDSTTCSPQYAMLSCTKTAGKGFGMDIPHSELPLSDAVFKGSNKAMVHSQAYGTQLDRETVPATTADDSSKAQDVLAFAWPKRHKKCVKKYVLPFSGTVSRQMGSHWTLIQP